MKRIICIFLVALIIVSCFSITVCAFDFDSYSVTDLVALRAGGGGSGGGSVGGSGGGGGSSGGSYGGTHHTGTGRRGSIIDTIIGFILIPIILFSSTIIFYVRISRRARKAKRLMKQIKRSDSAWKYNRITSTVEESFYAIQNAWTEMDMSNASQYMSEELLSSFQTKLNWMKYKNQRNVLEKIRLVKALPVAVHDDPDNSRDFAWFYIKGRMVDYTIDTDSQMVLEGNTMASSFVEYWQYIRKDDTWVLNMILQKNEENQIPFVE